jgi:hypothetical protein
MFNDPFSFFLPTVLSRNIPANLSGMGDRRDLIIDL